MANANVDLLGLQGGGQGDLANYVSSQGRVDPGELRPFIGKDGKPYVQVYIGGDASNPANYKVRPINTNATLRRDEWKRLDDAVLGISETRLGGVQDLITNGLTYNLGNAMGTTVFEWHDSSDALEAEVTMDGINRAVNDRVEFQHNYLPIPIIHADFEINARALAASRLMGNPLDTIMAERAARKVNYKLEQMLFTNTTFAYGATDSRARNSIYSYVNHPDRNQYTLPLAWTNAAITGALIMTDIRGMKQACLTAMHYGPSWMLYIPTAYETVMDLDYDPTAPDGTTVRERILKIGGIKGIKVIDTLPANNVLLVQMTSDVVRLINGLGLQSVQWSEEGKFVSKYKVLAIQVPQIRSDRDGNSGVVHATT